MKLKNVLSSLLLIVVLGGASVKAQNTQMPQKSADVEVSDAELTKFAEAFQKMRMVNQEAQQQMMQVIKDEGFELQRFNEIQQASMDPDKDVKTTPEEDKKHDAVVKKLEGMQPEFQKKMETIISDSDLSMERYQQLALALRTDKELQQRLQQILQS